MLSSQPVPQGSTANELRALARRHWTYFKYGTTSPSGTIIAKIEEGLRGAYDWAARQFKVGVDTTQQKIGMAESGERKDEL